ncbi:TOM (translocase of outer membrane) complex component [Tulasnella sp. UAMH 9824]|nr:TOM (translocase of outer membrane) complex component [Tulasnella sp. UAMH 9824]
MAPLAAPSSSSASDGLIDKIQNFVAENKKAVIIGSVVAAGGVGYYMYSRSSASSASDSNSLDSGDKKKKKKSGESGKKKGVNDPDGPLLEERKPKIQTDETSTDAPESPDLSPAEIAAMSRSERAALAAQYKSKGNAAYQKRDFARAIDLYSKAIAVAAVPEAVFYSNRAACYLNLQPPEYENVVRDCDEALKLDPIYIKALNRRAGALEALGRNEEALRDYTATTILEKFQNETTTQNLEKTLKTIAVAKTEEALATREPRLPNYHFIKSYLTAFRPKDHPVLPETPSQGDSTLLLAHEALAAGDYAHASTLVNESIEQGISWDEGKARALNLRGTFKFLVGETQTAKDDFLASIDLFPQFTQTLVKVASVHMELQDPVSAFAAFDRAIELDEKDPDIYYHRGQVRFLMSDFDAASDDYNKSTALDDKFIFSHIQYAVAQYKKGEAETAKASFRKAMQLFPQSSEPLNYYGELLLDLQRFPDAIEKFEKALELEKANAADKKGPINVLPLVNKALATYQWKQDINAAIELCEEAITTDPECDAAIATVAQLYLQTSRLDDAVKMFQQHSKIARTAPELEQCFTFEYATRAQQEFAKNYPTQAKELEQMAKAMAGAPPMP